MTLAADENECFIDVPDISEQSRFSVQKFSAMYFWLFLRTLRKKNNFLSRMIAIDQRDSVDFIVMQYVAGKTLDQITPRKEMKPGDALLQN